MTHEEKAASGRELLDAFCSMRALTPEQLESALRTHNETVLKIVSAAEGWSPEKLAALRADIGDLAKCFLFDNGEEIEVLTRDEKVMHALILVDQMLTLRELPATRLN